mgnify:CR=1 FL=1
MSSEPRLSDRALAILDAAIVAYSAVGLLYLATGGFDLGLLSVRRFSKPFLLLLVLASLRAAIPRPSWLPRLLGRAWGAIRERAENLERRTPWASSSAPTRWPSPGRAAVSTGSPRNKASWSGFRCGTGSAGARRR